MTFGRDGDQVYVSEGVPRNVEDDRRERAMRNAPALPPNRFAEQSRGNTMAPEAVSLLIARQREAEKASQAAPPPLIQDAAVACLAVLLEAIEDQKAGRPLSEQVVNALGDLSRILDTAQKRRLGLGVGYSLGPGT